MICLRPAKRPFRFADGGFLSRVQHWGRCQVLPFLLPLTGFAALPQQRADLSLPTPESPPSLELSSGGARTAEALAHYSSALQFEKAGKQREALDHYLAVLEVDPANPQIAMHAAELAYSFKGRPEAIALLEKAVKASPNQPEPYLNLARFCATYAPDDPFENDRAKQTLDTALKNFPKNAEVSAFAALTHLTRGARDEAIQVLDAAARQTVTQSSYWLTLGRAAQQVWPLAQVEMREEHLSRVNPFFEKVLRFASANQGDTVRLEVARYYLLTNQLELARDLCEKIAAQSGNLQARKLLYRLYDGFEEKDKALKVLEKIVEDAPQDVEQQRLLVGQYESREEFAKAVPHLEAAIQIGGGEAEDYQALGILMLRAQLFERLIQLSQRSIRLFPDFAVFHYQAAIAYRQLERWDDSVKSFHEAATLAENSQSELVDHQFYFQYGITLERAKRHDEAARIFEKSITLTPKDDLESASNTMNYLGYMWLELDRHLDKAGELIRKANELQPNNPAYVDSLGWWHFKKGNYPEAIQELERAISLLPQPQSEDAEIIEHMAQVYVKMNNPVKAREYYLRARNLQPADAKLQKRIEDGLKSLGTEP